MNVESLTATKILAVPLTEPERIFTGEADVAKMEFRILAGKWHPDRKGGNSDVFAHVKLLYDKAADKIAGGTWLVPGLLRVTDVKSRVYQMRYKKTRAFELGDVYIGDRIVTYSIKKEFADLVSNARQMIYGFTYANDQMRAEAARYLPQWHDQLELPDRILVVLKKDPEHICLRDIVTKLGKLEPRHAAWVMSRLHNLLCYFQWAGITHNDISLDNYFISPAGHVGSIIGGWWYAARVGQKMSALPERTIRYAKPDIVSQKKASFSVDAELIRAVVRESLGDPFGTKMVIDKSVPAPMVQWLQSPGSDSAYKDYSIWYDKVLIKAFGPRRFVRMELNGDIYD
jgi:hypothetical protein